MLIQLLKRFFTHTQDPPYLHLATSEMWCWSGGRGILKKNCLCVTILCTIIMVHKGIISSYRLVDCIRLWSCLVCSLSSERLCVFGLHGAIYIFKFFFLHPSLYVLVSRTWWDWPLTWLTNRRPSVLWHCWFGHVTGKPSPKWPIMCRVGR